MNTRLLLCFVLALLAGCRSPAAARKKVPDPAETKVTLYAEALTARDAGDLETARARLQSLLQISPNDSGVQRLLTVVEAALAAPRPVTPPPAPVVNPPVATASEIRPAPAAAVSLTPVARPNDTPVPAAGGMPAVIEEPAPNAPPRLPPDPRTQALVRVEAIGAALAAAPEQARTEQLMSYVQAQRALAAEYAREGNFIVAVGTLDAALATIRISTEELRAERAKYVQEDVKSRAGVRLLHRR